MPPSCRTARTSRNRPFTRHARVPAWSLLQSARRRPVRVAADGPPKAPGPRPAAPRWPPATRARTDRPRPDPIPASSRRGRCPAEPPGHRATGPPGHRATGPPGHRAMVAGSGGRAGDAKGSVRHPDAGTGAYGNAPREHRRGALDRAATRPDVRCGAAPSAPGGPRPPRPAGPPSRPPRPPPSRPCGPAGVRRRCAGPATSSSSSASTSSLVHRGRHPASCSRLPLTTQGYIV